MEKRDDITYKEPRNYAFLFKKHWFDFLFIILFIVVFTIELVFGLKDACSINEEGEKICSSLINSQYQDIRYYLNNFIIVVIPLTDTIITLSITIPDFEVFDIEYSEFRKIRGDYDYSLLSMIVISVILLALCILNYYLNLFITTLYLNALSLFYLILFSYKEMQILTRNQRYLFKLIRVNNNRLSTQNKKKNEKEKNPYSSNMSLENSGAISNDVAKQTESPKKESKSKNHSNETFTDKQSLMKRIKRDLLFKYGIVKTFKILRCKQKNDESQNEYDFNLFVDLLTLQNSYLSALIKNSELVKSTGTFMGYELSTIFGTFCDNLADIFRNVKDPHFLTISSNHEVSLLFVESFCHLKNVAENFAILDEYESDIKHIILLLIPDARSDDKNSQLTEDDKKAINLRIKTLNYLIIRTLCKDDLWFVKGIMSIYNPRNIYGLIKDALYYSFLVCYLEYMENCQILSDETRSQMKSLLEDEDLTIKSRTYLTNFNLVLSQKASALNSLLSIYHTGLREYRWVYEALDDNYGVFYDLFAEDYIIEWWAKRAGLDLSSLKPKDIQEIDNNLLNDSSKKAFDKYLYQHKKTNAKKKNESESKNSVTSPSEEKNDNTEDAISSQTGQEDDIINTLDFSEDNKKTSEFIDSQINNMTFISKDLPFEHNASIRSNVVTLMCDKKYNLYREFDLAAPSNYFKASLSSGFVFFINKVLDISDCVCDDYDDDTIKKIKEIEPQHKSISPNSQLNNIAEDEKEKLDLDILNSLGTINSFNPNEYDIYCANDAIKMNVKTGNKIEYRNLTGNELSSYIDKYCMLENGMYKFSSGGVSKIYYSRTDVETMIKENQKALDISLVVTFQIDKSKIVLVKSSQKTSVS